MQLSSFSSTKVVIIGGTCGGLLMAVLMKDPNGVAIWALALVAALIWILLVNWVTTKTGMNETRWTDWRWFASFLCIKFAIRLAPDGSARLALDEHVRMWIDMCNYQNYLRNQRAKTQQD